MKRISLIFAAALLATAGTAYAAQNDRVSGTTPNIPDKDAMSQQNLRAMEAARHKPEYKEGYNKGCSNAMWGTGANHPRSDRSDVYKFGWVSGYNNCSKGGSVNGAGGLSPAGGAGSR